MNEMQVLGQVLGSTLLAIVSRKKASNQRDIGKYVFELGWSLATIQAGLESNKWIPLEYPKKGWAVNHSEENMFEFNAVQLDRRLILVNAQTYLQALKLEYDVQQCIALISENGSDTSSCCPQGYSVPASAIQILNPTSIMLRVALKNERCVGAECGHAELYYSDPT